jgi:hypothetical protein
MEDNLVAKIHKLEAMLSEANKALVENETRELAAANQVKDEKVGGPVVCTAGCAIICGLTVGVGTAPAEVGILAGDCVSVCALSAGLAAIIAGAAV